MAATAYMPKNGASAATTAVTDEREPMKFVERIGSTDFIVSAKFLPAGKETLEDKVFRLLEREVSKSA
jgi:hypothetical protein